VLWAEGLSTAQIGLRLGVSRYAVAGARDRYGLPERGSPIKAAKLTTASRAQPLRPGESTLPPLPSLQQQ